MFQKLISLNKGKLSFLIYIIFQYMYVTEGAREVFGNTQVQNKNCISFITLWVFSVLYDNYLTFSWSPVITNCSYICIVIKSPLCVFCYHTVLFCEQVYNVVFLEYDFYYTCCFCYVIALQKYSLRQGQFEAQIMRAETPLVPVCRSN